MSLDDQKTGEQLKKVFEEEKEMIRQVEAGQIEMAIVFAPGFGAGVRANQSSKMTIYFWGGSALVKRSALTAGFSQAAQEISGRPFLVRLKAQIPGDADSKPSTYGSYP